MTVNDYCVICRDSPEGKWRILLYDLTQEKAQEVRDTMRSRASGEREYAACSEEQLLYSEAYPL